MPAIKINSSSEQEDEKEFSYKFYLGLDGRRSIVLGENSSLGGLKIGTIINNKFKTGLGIYWMRNDIVRAGIPGGNITDSRDTLFYNFGYTSLFFEPMFVLNRRWQLSFPMHLGSAVAETSYLTTQGKKQLFRTDKAPLFEVSGVGQYKFLRWLAIGTGIGYRALLIDRNAAQRALNAPVYILQLKVLFGVIWKTYLNKKIDDGWEVNEEK